MKRQPADAHDAGLGCAQNPLSWAWIGGCAGGDGGSGAGGDCDERDGHCGCGGKVVKPGVPFQLHQNDALHFYSLAVWPKNHGTSWDCSCLAVTNAVISRIL